MRHDCCITEAKQQSRKVQTDLKPLDKYVKSDVAAVSCINGWTVYKMVGAESSAEDFRLTVSNVSNT